MCQLFVAKASIRFAELERRIEGVNQKMLIQQLEKDGIVARKVYPQGSRSLSGATLSTLPRRNHTRFAGRRINSRGLLKVNPRGSFHSDVAVNIQTCMFCARMDGEQSDFPSDVIAR
ncbi:winged helix-turn-helix transcriptional regulator [Sphingobium sp. AN558]|uniref:winged helix-turn-helix transcriptional regulator n=1 Tax=Sphingobium sp. AN558 TaxID=3133442 RepID=UPI0030BA6986